MLYLIKPDTLHNRFKWTRPQKKNYTLAHLAFINKIKIALLLLIAAIYGKLATTLQKTGNMMKTSTVTQNYDITADCHNDMPQAVV